MTRRGVVGEAGSDASRHNGGMHVSAKTDYGMRALLELAAVHAADPERMAKGSDIAAAQDIPVKFLEGILSQLRQAGIVTSQRGAAGGYRLDRQPNAITLADVTRALDGPLVGVRGQRPEDVEYTGASVHLQEVWIAVRSSLRQVLERITLADVAAGTLPPELSRLLAAPGAWERR